MGSHDSNLSEPTTAVELIFRWAKYAAPWPDPLFERAAIDATIRPGPRPERRNAHELVKAAPKGTAPSARAASRSTNKI